MQQLVYLYLFFYSFFSPISWYPIGSYIRCHSRTDSGEAKVESRASSETQPSQATLLLDTCPLNPEARHTNVSDETLYTWRPCKRALHPANHRSCWSTMGQKHPCQPNSPLTRMMLGQLCTAPQVTAGCDRAWT